ncbi:MAG: valine--pyruvate transaminase [Agarilytica sp.]
MKLSKLGHKLTEESAIVSLMEDLGTALNVNPDLLFLGGGNPAHIPEFESIAAKHLQDIAADPDQLHKLLGVYQSPQGMESFISLFVDYMQKQMQWPISSRNVALSNGSQSAFFIFINLLCGTDVLGVEKRQIVFPMMPEYLGYSDQACETDVFRSVPPIINETGDKRFKYQVDFSALNICDTDAAICVSRPTNPTGNVLTQEEIEHLNDLACEHEIPLIIDCAYGEPFPGIFYEPSPIDYSENIIYMMSCSKLGLPGVRTGIVVASEYWIEKFVGANTVMCLANGNLGPQLMSAMLEKENIPALCSKTLLPFYRKQRDFAIDCVEKYFSGIDYKLHEPEGAFFLWLWFPGLGISSTELYESLKEAGVLVMDGKHFFFGLDKEWPHAKECIRLTYCQNEAIIDQAMQIIAGQLNK